MDSVDAFALEARLFEQWLLHASDQDADAAREALARLLGLYRAALDLPPAWSDELGRGADVERLTDDQWRRAYDASRRLPVDLYSEVTIRPLCRLRSRSAAASQTILLTSTGTLEQA